MVSDTRFTAYVDEAGDFGLRSIVPIDPNGASEWFVLAAVLVRSVNEGQVQHWLRAIRDAARNRQAPSLHFRKLTDRQKLIVAERLAQLPLRIFVLISNKRNMRNHRNAKAARVSGHKHWFYWWCTRLLLERVTAYCALRNRLDGHSDGRLRLEFSRRQDLRYDQFKDYFTRIWWQERPVLDRRTVDWSVFDFESVTFHDHDARAGLQLADIAASAFYQAVNTHPHGSSDARSALALSPRIWRTDDGALDAGFSVQPGSLKHVPLTAGQRCVFEAYGYPSALLGKAAARGLSPDGV